MSHERGSAHKRAVRHRTRKPPHSAPTGVRDDKVSKILERAAEGLLYTSETDAPFTWFCLSGAVDQMDVDTFRRVAAIPEATQVEEQTLAEFFRPMIDDVDPADEVAQANRSRFGALKHTVEAELKCAHVFRVGEVQIRIHLVGVLPSGAVGGLMTEAMET